MEMDGERVPWLERHIEALKMVETSRRLKHVYVYTSEEIVRTVGERYRRVRRRKPGFTGRIEFEIKRLETVFNVAYSRLARIANLPLSSEMSPFHRALVQAFVGDEYDRALRKVRRSLKLIRSFWDEYRLLIASAETGEEAARLRKEGSGRILSVVRRLRKDLELLRRVRDELLKAHVISEGLPVVVVAGIPSAGKSTLIRSVSTAEPEVASYPFTTKNIIVGKVKHKNIQFYMVDTPGILERPAEQHNEIERKALAALKTLPDVILFLVDPSTEKVQGLNEQARLLKSIYNVIVSERSSGLIVAINKIDIASREEVEKAAEIFSNMISTLSSDTICSREVKLVSALTGAGVEELLDSIVECLRRKAPWIFSSNPLAGSRQKLEAQAQSQQLNMTLERDGKGV